VRVGVDARHLDAGRGVAVYLEGMLGALTGVQTALLVPGRAPLGPAARALAARPGVRVVRTRAPGRALFGAAAVTGEPTLRRLLGDVDVLWIPAPAPVAAGNAPYVLTVHDRSFEARPGDFTPYERAWHRLARPRALARGAARVVTDTAAVRDELQAAWGLQRVSVVQPGVPRRAAAPPRGTGAYVLFVGALEPRKDPVALARAAATAGVEAWFAGTGRLAEAVHTAGGRLLGRVGDAELGALMAGALALVLPSRLEGFGFPPLEAALCGTPSIVAGLPVLRETLGDDGALFVAPGDEAALVAAIRRLRDDAALRAALVAAAAGRARQLTWERAAAALRAVLEAAAR
jgi:glycosyltransferase involved in cell wall biosynthesis